MITIDETLYNKMPDDIKRCFTKDPNPNKDEVLECFPDSKSSSRAGFVPSKGGRVYRGNSLLSSKTIYQGSMVYGDSGSAARFFYCAKASKAERGENNIHPTVKPIALMRYLVRLVTPPNGTVLDPFLGSGTTAIAAIQEGYEWIGIEREKEYCEIAARRIETELEQTDLFREEQ